MELLLTNQHFTLTTQKPKFKTCVNEFWNYVKDPKYIAQNTTMALHEKVSFIKQLLKLELLLLIVIVPLIVYTKRLTGATSIGWGDDWDAYFSIVILAPIVEETVFRYGLKFSRIVVAFLAWLPIYYIIKHTVSDDSMGKAIGLSLILIPIFWVLIENFRLHLERMWRINFTVIFHISAIIFGLIHLSNYSNINNYFLAIPLVSSQIVAGYVLGFVRMKFGLFYSMGLHSVWNFITSLALLIPLILKLF
jgi:membrane protease YdiL (CAAX protease family)